MSKYTNNHCAICLEPLPRPQNTCGSRECMAEWKLLSRESRHRALMVAHMSLAERFQYEQMQPPDPDAAAPLSELADQPALPSTPSFIRDMLAPENLIPEKKGGDSE